MNQSFEQIGFTIETTLDGSPTLRLPERSDRRGESMHHSGGAAAETFYIYGSIMEKVHLLYPKPTHTCVVGLGLGYIEMAWALSLIKNFEGLKRVSKSQDLSKTPVEGCGELLNYSLHSYEKVIGLQQTFAHWVRAESNPKTNETYEAALDGYLRASNSSKLVHDVKTFLKRSLTSNLQIRNDFENNIELQNKYHMICYDAFSQKTDEGLWSFEFLDRFLKNHTEPDCVLTTYACTGNLKKALVENGFTVYKRLGFQGKRDSTLAVRGSFIQVEWFAQTF